MRAEGIGFGNGVNSSLHSNPFIETYFNSRVFQKLYSRERLDKYRKENLCPVNQRIGKETGLSLGERISGSEKGYGRYCRGYSKNTEILFKITVVKR